MPYPGVGFPTSPFEWPHVGRQWPSYNLESDQAEELKGWWPMLGLTRDPNVLTNLIGGEQATFVNTPTWEMSPVVGRVLHCSRANSEYVDTNYSLSATIGVGHTVSFWVYFNVVNVSWQSVFDAAVGGNRNVQLWLQNDGTMFYHVNQAYFGDHHSAATFVANRLYHVAMTWPSGAAVTVSLYIDGVYDSSHVSGSESPASIDLYFGTRAHDQNASSMLDGSMADPRWYDREYSASEVAQLFNPTTRWELYRLPRKIWHWGVVVAPTGNPWYVYAQQ